MPDNPLRKEWCPPCEYNGECTLEPGHLCAESWQDVKEGNTVTIIRSRASVFSPDEADTIQYRDGDRQYNDMEEQAQRRISEIIQERGVSLSEAQQIYVQECHAIINSAILL